MQVKIKLLHDGIMPTKKTAGAAAYDCYAREDVIVKEEPVLIGLGFALELPDGYHAEIVPRSSIGLNTNLRQPNCVGVIDSDYRGEIKVPLFNQSSVSQTIEKGERIAQLMFLPVPEVNFVTPEEYKALSRGDGGLGSTGK